jgi:hypothetical protein
MWLAGATIVFDDDTGTGRCVITDETIRRAREHWGNRSIRPVYGLQNWTKYDALMAWLCHQLPFGLIATEGHVTFTAAFAGFPVGGTGGHVDWGLRLTPDSAAFDISNEGGDDMIYASYLRFSAGVMFQFAPGGMPGLFLEIDLSPDSPSVGRPPQPPYHRGFAPARI